MAERPVLRPKHLQIEEEFVREHQPSSWKESRAEYLREGGRGQGGPQGQGTGPQLQPRLQDFSFPSVHWANSVELPGCQLTGRLSLVKGLLCPCQGPRKVVPTPAEPSPSMALRSLVPPSPGSAGLRGLQREKSVWPALWLCRRGGARRRGLLWPLAPGSPTYP